MDIIAITTIVCFSSEKMRRIRESLNRKKESKQVLSSSKNKKKQEEEEDEEDEGCEFLFILFLFLFLFILFLFLQKYQQ